MEILSNISKTAEKLHNLGTYIANQHRYNPTTTHVNL